jgi:hypothetical protein
MFAGYQWRRGPVTSVAGSWTVPGIVGGRSRGVAGTWIGAQTAPGPGPFIQIGSNEQRLVLPSAAPGLSPTVLTAYVAFWSDTVHHFHPQVLFPVGPGDHLSATLTLARGRWMLAIADATSGRTRRFATTDDARARFRLAEWAQEDVEDARTHRPFPYPALSTVGFRRLAVDSTAPAYADLYSTWMSENGRNLAPTPLRHDAYTLREATVSAAGARYLSIALAAGVTAQAFRTEIARWTAATPRAAIAAQTARYAAALGTEVRALSAARWPATFRARIDTLVRRERTLLALTRSAPGLAPGRRAAWRSAWERAERAATSAAHVLRRALHVPELTPLK